MKFNKQKLNLFKRSVKFWWQRRVRGWDDSDTWSLDYSLPKVILPRLKRFKKLKIGVPEELSVQEWNSILDKMIAAFEFAGSEKRWLSEHKEYENHQEGLDLFAKYYWNLWW
jgi:hypothetical protein